MRSRGDEAMRMPGSVGSFRRHAGLVTPPVSARDWESFRGCPRCAAGCYAARPERLAATLHLL